MIERVKSAILTILILTSLLLSGMLWYRTPNTEEINRVDYIPQQLIGEARQLEELVKPRSVVYHSGNGTHFMAFAGDPVYDQSVNHLTEWQLAKVEEVTLSTADWEQLLAEYPGWELRFPTAIPGKILFGKLLSGMDELEEHVAIDRVWIYQKQNDINVLFIADLINRVYKSKAIVDEEEMLFSRQTRSGLLPVTPVTERLVSAQPYEPVRLKMSYFPRQVTAMPAWKAPLQEIDVEQMKNLLFLDPSLVRTVTDTEEGAVTMQDGTRSARYVESDHMLYYQNYKLKIEPKPIDVDLSDAIQFINRHGGWMVDHRLVNVEDSETDDRINRYEFRMVKDGLPVYDNGQQRYGTVMTTETKGGHVLRYERSLHFTSEDEFVRSSSIPGGQEALDQLLASFDPADIRDMFPAYHIAKEEEELFYVPGWRIQLTTGEEMWFEAPGEEGERADGLE